MTALHAIVGSSWFIPLVTTILILAIVPLFIGYMSLVERKVLADLQARYGPTRVGPRGLLQPVADALKFLLKEDIVPANAERLLFCSRPSSPWLPRSSGSRFFLSAEAYSLPKSM